MTVVATAAWEGTTPPGGWTTPACERLAISPRCGFASSQVGGAITLDDQWRRLELVAELAREVWP
jgi:hypothetical protein